MPLSPEEVVYAEKVVGRSLTLEEKALLEAEWSEHCSYKSTRSLLKQLPTRAPWVIVGPGRDAGVVKLFEDVAVVARIESHNHPSAVEPYNGAATGVGGVVRDVLALGAKPVLLLNALYLGDPSSQHARWLARGVVRGASDYGNRVGIPTASGHTWFSKSYNKQPIVNVACIGVTKPGTIIEGAVEPGDVIVLVGNATGREGVLGSSFASKPLAGGEEPGAMLVGDPFLEKLLIDALLEAFEKKLLRHVKDIGAGGLAIAVAETAAHNNVGALVHLDKVHTRDPGLSPVEILVSESQERMLLVPRKGMLGELLSILDKHGVEYSVIGYFTCNKRLRFLYKGVEVVNLPVDLVANPPIPRRHYVEPQPPPSLPRIEADVGKTLLTLLSRPNIGSKSVIYERFDWGVGGRTVGAPGFYDAAIVWLRDGSLRGFAAAVYGNPRFTALDPWRGAALSLLTAYRRVAVVGAEPLAVLDVVNSGNPEKPWQHSYTVKMIQGIAWAASELGLPVVGGKVSLYNEDSSGVMVDPVTTVLVIGRITDVSKATPSLFRCGGVVVLAGETRPELGGSEAVELVYGSPAGRPPEPRPLEEKSVARLAVKTSEDGMVCSAHSVGRGGLLVALAKMAVKGGAGVSLDLTSVCSECSFFEAAFSETPARIVFEVYPNKLEEFMDAARRLNVPVRVLGNVAGGSEFTVRYRGETITLDLNELAKAYQDSLKMLEGVG